MIEGTLDFETDPFEYGAIPYPFACGVYFSDDKYRELWEPNIIDKTVAFLKTLPECILYAHNGGKFDFHYLIEYSNHGEITIRNGRVTHMNIGKVRLVDSWPLMPFALAEYQKTKIDYNIFRSHRRNSPRNKVLIQKYLKDDCRDLLNLLRGFKEIVGPKDTIGGSAFYQMKKLGIHIQQGNENHDDMFRPYFFGGRVQAFAKGIFRGRYNYYDINSAYPYAMTHNHAHGMDYRESRKRPKAFNHQFVHLLGHSRGALPVRGDDGSISFPDTRGEFRATGWEVQAGIETKTLIIDKILGIWTPQHTINFASYVDRYFKLKQEAKEAGDRIHYLAYKYLTNSGYGKLAQNPRDFKEYILAPYGVDVSRRKNCSGFEWECDFGAVSLWARPSYDGFGFYDVATGASITGFVRAMLWRAIQRSREPLHCHTDSLICRSANVPQSAKLGHWKRENKGVLDVVAVAGKMLYGIHSTEAEFDGFPTKIASKGVRLNWQEILDLCRGKTVKWRNEAPTFSLGGAHFIERNITMT